MCLLWESSTCFNVGCAVRYIKGGAVFLGRDGVGVVTRSRAGRDVATDWKTLLRRQLTVDRRHGTTLIADFDSKATTMTSKIRAASQKTKLEKYCWSMTALSCCGRLFG